MQITMSRAGRKRAPRGYLASQAPKVDYREETARQPHRVGLGAIVKRDANGKLIDLRISPEAATPFGQLFLTGLLDRPGDPETGWRRHEAGKRYAEIVQGYLSSIGAPRGEFPQGKGYPCTGHPQCGQRQGEPDCECRKRKLAYDGAFEALAEVGHRAQVEVAHVTVHGRKCQSVAALIVGLDALVRHLLTDRRKDAQSKYVMS